MNGRKNNRKGFHWLLMPMKIQRRISYKKKGQYRGHEGALKELCKRVRRFDKP